MVRSWPAPSKPVPDCSLTTPPAPPFTRGGKCSFNRFRGVTLVEVIVVFAIVAIALLFLLMMMPRGREQARLLACQKNLGQIGKALAIYHQTEHQLPAIVALAGIDEPNAHEIAGPAARFAQYFAIARLDRSRR